MRSASSTTPTVLLFDIDGTLILTGGAGRRAMTAAFADVHRNGEACSHFSFAGMTDRAIVREGLRVIHAANGGGTPDEAGIDAVLEAYLKRLADEVARAGSYRVLPGVEVLLQSLRGEPGLAIGLGTGNVRRGAMTKLARGSLDVHFAFGGFGCDAEDRAELLRAGAHRGAAALGVRIEECRVVIIGDTPKDVAAALAIDAVCIGVGTGGFAPEELVKLGAKTAFATLAENGAREALLASP
ncbi:Hydrolase, haloacid dehalogenase-like family [Labilithrix luteola]|uniref:phosphoglycolate phosphatase n=1 Tax=Labilithrix luteola TaxID=1391654 RepID=A0A0K1PXG2_9BACT|nr:HAD family hydrolase [Labilithrix luteola]AKU98210.1 Hydrolase, haloacid dehalogenase-like family [Labilithrix luteola]